MDPRPRTHRAPQSRNPGAADAPSRPPPRLAIPGDLPIAAHAGTIREWLRQHPVIIVAGATGSGKTTQLPKIAMMAGRGRTRLIGCTQPRRLAVTTVARRVAEELGPGHAALVGYQHRFERTVSRETRIKFMTDGVLLAETRHDPLLRAYDTLILDEAHERSLNIDLLLGRLKGILARRRDLRLVVSSATLDPGKFSAFFDGAPVLAIDGRTYPVEIRYQPAGEGDDADLPRQVADALELCDSTPYAGDTLVFLPGERDIRETAETLRGRKLADTDVIPLLASSPVSDQQRAFQVTSRRRVILATNVAETSVTLPGIRCVIDSGLARTNRYAHRTQTQRLHVEPISQASADQRAGRCGRVAPGLCVRLYSLEDYERRPPFTDPEILRASLAGVVLAMLDLRLGDIENFPFPDPPTPARIRDGIRELQEIGAVSPNGRLTPLGRKLAAFPVDPRLARILLAAQDEKSLHDALIVVSALEADDPRQRPVDRQAEADAAHAKFRAPDSDFAGILLLWRWFDEQARSLSVRATRKLCQEHFLSYPRMREWRDLREQLARQCRLAGLDPGLAGGGDAGLHRALLCGLLSRIGQRDPQTGDYRGARATRFAIHPGSVLAKKPPAWLLAGELVDTSRLFARQAAAIDPDWIEPIAGDLCRYSYHSPEWDARHGFVRATERVTLYGLVIVEGRRRDFTRIDPAACRGIFLRNALVEGAFADPVPAFLEHNLRLVDDLRDNAAKLRRAAKLPDEEALAAFYDERIPAGIATAGDLRRWARHTATPDELRALFLDGATLRAEAGRADGHPDHLRMGSRSFALLYRYAPRERDDGITCVVPADSLPLLQAWPYDWLVPGALADKVAWMLGSLPARLRSRLSPLDETAAVCVTRLGPAKGPLADALARVVHDLCGARVPAGTWAESTLPDPLRMNFRVVDAQGKPLAESRDFPALLERFHPERRAAGGRASETAAELSPVLDPRWHRDGLDAWTFGTLPGSVDVGEAGWTIRHFPALADAGDSVSLRLFPTAAEAAENHLRGVLRLLVLALGRPRWRSLCNAPRLGASAADFAKGLESPGSTLAEDIAWHALRRAALEDGPPPYDAPGFEACLARARSRVERCASETRQLVAALLHAAADRQSVCFGEAIPEESAADITEQIAWLLPPGFARTTPWKRLLEIPRYLDGIRVRQERLGWNAAADARRLAALLPHWIRYRDFARAAKPAADPAALADYRWGVEELRIQTFAQELKTPAPVSARRLDALWSAATGES
jgi:ATP-dependent helicase HrpA